MFRSGHNPGGIDCHFDHIVERTGIGFWWRPNATGMAAYHGLLQSGVGDQTVKRHSILGEAHRQSKTTCFQTLKTDVSASP
jgi:hypothetical protein